VLVFVSFNTSSRYALVGWSVGKWRAERFLLPRYVGDHFQFGKMRNENSALFSSWSSKICNKSKKKVRGLLVPL